MSKYELTPTIGLSPGMTVQFAEGCWPGDVGEGLGMSDAAFNLVEPYLLKHCRGWTSEHRFGMFELEEEEAGKLCQAFREAKPLDDNASFFPILAKWLEPRCAGKKPILILGY